LVVQSLREAVAQQTSAAQAADERWRAQRDKCADTEARLLRSEADAATAKREQQVCPTALHTNTVLLSKRSRNVHTSLALSFSN